MEKAYKDLIDAIKTRTLYEFIGNNGHNYSKNRPHQYHQGTGLCLL